MEEVKTKSLQELVDEIHARLEAGVILYNKLDKELDPHKGLPIEETNMQEVERIYTALVNTFNKEIYPLYKYIIDFNEEANRNVNTFVSFVNSVKRAEEPSQIITTH